MPSDRQGIEQRGIGHAGTFDMRKKVRPAGEDKCLEIVEPRSANEPFQRLVRPPSHAASTLTMY